MWLSETDIKLASEYALKEYITKRRTFEKRLKTFYANIDKIDEIYEKYSYKKIQNSDWNKLIKLVDEIRNLIWDANAAVIFTIYLDKEFCWDILKSTGYEISKEELEKIWPHATEPAFESFDKSQQELFLNLLKNNKNISEIAEECQYFFTDYFSAKNPDVVKANLEEKFANFISERKLIKDALQNDAEKLGTATEKHEKWLVTLPENQKKIAEYLQLIMKTRDRRKNFFAKGLTVIHRIAEKMFSEVGLSYDLIPFYTMKELVKGVGYLRDNVDILKTRTKGFQLLIPASSSVKMLEIPIEQAVEKVNEFFVTSHTTESGVDILNGQVGSRGSVRGNVRIVLNVNSNHGFKNGEILVTGMTRPEYIPLMKKAAGIVTDEGGITCHAAIVSRELGIPCVIGTKIATRKLKDGDLVEVDANKGIVKIIK